MLIPIVDSWIKENLYIVIIIQKSSQVRTFMMITMWAGVGKVFEFITSTMFNANYVVDLKRSSSCNRQYSQRLLARLATRRRIFVEIGFLMPKAVVGLLLSSD